MTIQEYYRKRGARKQAFASINELSTQFERIKSAFSPPPQLDYRGPTSDNTLGIPVSSDSYARISSIPPPSDTTETSKPNPGLAFTPNNKVLLEYIENLNRLLDDLDSVESGGDTSIREQRKHMISNVDAEAQRIDRWIAAVWAQP